MAACSSGGSTDAEDAGTDAPVTKDGAADVTTDTGRTDVDANDAGASEGSADSAVDADADAGETFDCTTTTGQPPSLECSGLYSTFATKTVAPGTFEFKPGIELWSDAAVKRRWIRFPPGSKVDVTDLNKFVFPVGTQVWKEFKVQVGSSLKRIETRYMVKTGEFDWFRTTYEWAEDESSTRELTSGRSNVPGTQNYEIPTQASCVRCHGGSFDNLLGFGAVLLGAPSAGLGWNELKQKDLLTSTNGVHMTDVANLQIQGNLTEKAALGYLHVNCGVSCHNPQGQGGGRFNAKLDFNAQNRLEPATDVSVVKTAANKTSGFQPMGVDGGTYYIIRPGDPSRSSMIYRMSRRDTDGGTVEQMPPIATHRVDDAGVGIVETWIRSLNVDAGYPEAGP